MVWLTAAFIGAFLSGCANFIDKYLLEKKIKDPLSMIAFIAVTALITVSILWGILDVGHLSLSKSYLLILSGVLVFCAMIIYFNVLREDHVSFVVVFFQLIPVLIVLEGIFIFREPISLIQLLGIGLVVISAIALSWIDNISDSFQWTITRSSIIKMLIFDILWALSVLCIKVSSVHATFPQIIMYEQIGLLAGSLFVLLISSSLRKSVATMIQTTSQGTKIIALFNESLLVFLSKVCYDYAYSYGKISIASVGESSHVLFVVLMGAFFTILYPKIFKENLEANVLFKKIIYIFFMLFGIYLIT